MRTVLFLITIALGVLAQDAPKRPRITGIAHVAFYASDVKKARTFYEDLLGYQEPYNLSVGGSLIMSLIKINDRQYVEIHEEKAPGTDRLKHVAIETDDVAAMRISRSPRAMRRVARVRRFTGSAIRSASQ